MAFKSLADYDQEAVCKPGRKVGSNRISGHHFGPGRAAVIRSRGVAAKQGFLMYYTKGDAIGTKVSVRYRESGRLSGVVVKRGSTVNFFVECFAPSSTGSRLFRFTFI